MAIVRERRQFSAGPIGVVRASSAGEVVGQGISNFAGTVGGIMYQEAAKKAKKVGAETALGAEREDIITIDPSTGKPVAYEVPDTFGTIAADAYQNVVLDRFQTSINEEIKLKAKELASKYEDPQTFSAMLGDYVSAMAGNSEGMFEEYITNTGESYRRSTEANLVAAKIAKERAAAAQSVLTNNNQAIEQAFDLGAAGDIEGAIALIEGRAGKTVNAISAGLLTGGSDVAARDSISASAISGSLQGILEGATALESASVATYLSTQGERGAENLTDTQRATLDSLKPYITRSNQSSILSEFNRIQGGYDAIRSAKIAEQQAKIDAEFEQMEAAVTKILLGQVEGDTSAMSTASITMSQAFEVGIVDEMVSTLDGYSQEYSDRNLELAATGAMTPEKAADLNRDRRRAISEGILSQIGSTVTEAQKGKIADYLNSGNTTYLNGLPEGAAQGIYGYANSGLYQSEDRDFAADFMSKSVSDMQLQVEKNLAQYDYSQEIVRIQGAVRNGTATEADFKDFGVLTSQLLNDGVIDDTVVTSAGRGMGLAQGKYIASRAGSSASSIQLTALSAYIASSGEDDAGLPEYLRSAGDSVIASVEEEDLLAASNHVNGMAEDRRKVEAEQKAAQEKMNNLAEIAAGFGDAADKEHRKLVDEVLDQQRINIFDPDSVGSRELYDVMASAPSQMLVDSLTSGANGNPNAGFEVALEHYKYLSNLPDSSGSFINRFGASLKAADKQFLTDVIEISRVSGSSPASVAADLHKIRTDADLKSLVDTALGGKTPRVFVENNRSGYATIPEVDTVVEYWASNGRSESEILERLDSFVKTEYGSPRSGGRYVYVYDPRSGLSGYTRGNLEITFPNEDERRAFKNIVEDNLTSIKSEQYPNGLSLLGVGGSLSDKPQKAWLSPVPNTPKGTYSIVTQNEFGEIIPLFVDVEGEDGKTETQWLGFDKGDTEAFRKQAAADLKAEAQENQIARTEREAELKEADEIAATIPLAPYASSIGSR